MQLPAFVEIPDCTVTLGWRFDDVMSHEAKAAIEEYLDDYDYRSNLFSPLRTVSLKRYSIASKPILWTELIDDPTPVNEADSIGDICSRLNEQLHAIGLRLPTEDELEAACGGSLFSWGDTIPDGIPSANRTTFTRHMQPNANGILFNSDTYAVEITDGYFKLGDGGVSVCGGEPWPMAWLALSPAFRLPEDIYIDCLAEFLEGTFIHPVRAY
ncbi:hypothetical protein [Bremerella sp.]|uniref:hypothetical protein n=1 Tax=Bremerella sp. TaxID=2795602 RepID=UPI00391BC893